MTHAELAGLPLSRRHILPLWMPSGMAQLEAAGFLHCLSCSANQRKESAREAFSLHFSPPVICHDPRDGVYRICQNDWDNLSGELLLRLLSNLSWQQSGGIGLGQREREPEAVLPGISLLMMLKMLKVKPHPADCPRNTFWVIEK